MSEERETPQGEDDRFEDLEVEDGADQVLGGVRRRGDTSDPCEGGEIGG